MARKTGSRSPAEDAPAEGAEGTEDPSQPSSSPKDGARLALVRRLIGKWAEYLETQPGKSGIGDLVRLLVLEGEMSESEEEIKEIKVSWVEPSETESSESE